MYRCTAAIYTSTLPKLTDGAQHTLDTNTSELDAVLRTVEELLQQHYAVTATVEPRAKGIEKMRAGRTLACVINHRDTAGGIPSAAGLVELTLHDAE